MAEPLVPTVFVVDDDLSMRSAIRRLLASVALACETFATPAEFLDRLEFGLSGCVVLDVRMPETSGLDLQRILREKGNDLPIVFITAHADVPLAVRAMKAGALEVLTKPFDDQSLLDAVHLALETERILSREREQTHRLRSRFETLTARERQVMALLARGMSNKQMASELGTSVKTIKAHRARVKQKMAAESLSDLIRMSDRLIGPPNAVTPL